MRKATAQCHYALFADGQFALGQRGDLVQRVGRHEVTIKNFTGAVKAGDLQLVALCSECREDVARVES